MSPANPARAIRSIQQNGWLSHPLFVGACVGAAGPSDRNATGPGSERVLGPGPVRPLAITALACWARAGTNSVAARPLQRAAPGVVSGSGRVADHRGATPADLADGALLPTALIAITWNSIGAVLVKVNDRERAAAPTWTDWTGVVPPTR